MAGERSEKILIIGVKVPGLHSAKWFEGDLPNIADYDLVIANCLSLEAEMQKVPEGGNLSREARSHWNQRLEAIRERTRKLLKSDGSVVAIVGSEVVRVTESDPDNYLYPEFVSSFDWIPIPVQLTEESGDTSRVIVEKLQTYISTVRRWTYVSDVEKERSAEERVDELSGEHDAKHITVRLRPVAVNRQNSPIAAVFDYGIHGGNWESWSKEPEKWSGDLFILPPPTDLDCDAAIKVLLKDMAGIELSGAPEPEWFSGLAVYGESQLRAEADTLATQQSELAFQVSELEQRRSALRQYLRLLFADGLDLQSLARSAFEEMGLATREIDPEISDEFLVGHDGREFLVEVKGRVTPAQASDIRQLDEALDKYQRATGEQIKGVLVVNGWRTIPPPEREAHGPVFSDNIVRRAVAIEVALITGEQLLCALESHWKGEVTGVEFFTRLVATDGPFQFEA